jgi:hypothetical protein
MERLRYTGNTVGGYYFRTIPEAAVCAPTGRMERHVVYS